ncbi:MAG TPA: glycosyltransferase, partial [Nocardioidaceae bacterium]
MTEVRVTLVLPCLNESAGLRTLMGALEKAFSQTPHLTVTALFVDDGSTDDTQRVLQRFASRIRYVYQNNRGLSAARNTG